jgi:hypothetical protein
MRSLKRMAELDFEPFLIQIIAPDGFFADFIVHYDFSAPSRRFLLLIVHSPSFVIQFIIALFLQLCCIYDAKNLLLRCSIFTHFFSCPLNSEQENVSAFG